MPDWRSINIQLSYCHGTYNKIVMADGKQQEVEKDKVAKVEEEGVASRVVQFVKFASNYGNEDRYDPDFTWYSMISSHHLSCSLVRPCSTPYLLLDTPRCSRLIVLFNHVEFCSM